MNSTPSPALVTERAAQPLPRSVLLLFCAAYVLPGLFGRDPWKAADITAFGAMMNIARGSASWWIPAVADVPLQGGGLLPYWLGAIAIRLTAGVGLDAAFAARLPFAVLLLGVLMLTWYATYHLARAEDAQPLPFAFGGEAKATDYARAIADGAVLALIATLGLLQLGHETTPELVQLSAVAAFLYGLAASPFRRIESRLAVTLALPVLATSGAPAIAVCLAIVGLMVSLRSSHERVRALVPWIVAGGGAAAALASGLGAWGWRTGRYANSHDVWLLLRFLLWFAWPAWLLALWTLWRWRGHWRHRHLSVPSLIAAVGLMASIVMGGSDRALMLATPAMAVLAAFALPTLRRSLSSAIDWFSVAFFSAAALAIWVIYLALQTGVPAKPAANVMRLAPGYVSTFSAIGLGFAVLGTLAWLWLVRWRTSRHRNPLWKSLVLPASGVALCWLLLMTLGLPLLDYARSYRPLIQAIGRHIPVDACIRAQGLAPAELAALEYMGRYRVDATQGANAPACDYLLLKEQGRRSAPAVPGFGVVARERRPTDRDEATVILRRDPASPDSR